MNKVSEPYEDPDHSEGHTHTEQRARREKYLWFIWYKSGASRPAFHLPDTKPHAVKTSAELELLTDGPVSGPGSKQQVLLH